MILTGMSTIAVVVIDFIRLEEFLIPVGLKHELLDGEGVGFAAWLQHNRKMLHVGLVISDIPKKAIDPVTIILLDAESLSGLVGVQVDVVDRDGALIFIFLDRVVHGGLI